MRDFLFADDAAIVAHSAEDLQQLMNRFSKACQDFGLTISLKKTQVMGHNMKNVFCDSPHAFMGMYQAICVLASKSDNRGEFSFHETAKAVVLESSPLEDKLWDIHLSKHAQTHSFNRFVELFSAYPECEDRK